MSAPQDAAIGDGGATESTGIGDGEQAAQETPATGEASAAQVDNAEVEKLRAESRAFQSKVDRLQQIANDFYEGDLEKALTGTRAFGNLAQTRDDFVDYLQGNSRSNGAAEEDFRSDEEKRLDEHDRRLTASERRSQSAIAELNFTRAEAGMDDFWGDLWHTKKSEMLGKVREMTQNGLLTDPTAINDMTLQQIFFSTLTDRDELTALVTKLAQRKEEQRVGHQQGMETSAPSDRGGSVSQPRVAKTLKEAWEFAQRDAGR